MNRRGHRRLLGKTRDQVLGEGEGPACKGVETQQTRSFILHVPLSGCPNYLRHFRFKDLSRHFFFF